MEGRALAARVRDDLAGTGFEGHGVTLSVKAPAAWGLIQLQSRSTPAGRLWTANLGVSHHVIAAAMAGTPLERPFASGLTRPPRETDCHWRDRLGFHAPNPRDHWWNLADDAAAEEMRQVIVKFGAPAVTSRLDPATLLEEWLRAPDEYLGESLAMLFAWVVARELGDDERAGRARLRLWASLPGPEVVATARALQMPGPDVGGAP